MKPNIKLFMSLTLTFLLLLGGCATTKKETTANQPVTFKNKTKSLQTYRAGLQQVIDSIPNDQSASAEFVILIEAIKRFLYPEVFWGYIDANNQMFSLSSGHKGGLWVLFLENDHNSLLDPGPTLVTGKQGELNAVTVRPDKVSERWAGILLMHELAHGFEKLFAKGSNANASEYHAYLVEMESYNFITENNLNRGLDKLLDKYAIHNHQDLLTLTSSSQGLIYEFLYELDKILKEDKPLSIAAEEMRLAFYLMAASIRIGQLNDASLDEKIKNINVLLTNVGLY